MTYNINIMKKLLFVLIGIFTISLANAQKLKVNEVDKFTKSVKKQTSSETLYGAGAPGWVKNRFNFSIRKIGDSYSMTAFIVLDDMGKYTDDSGIILLLSNDETIELQTLYTGIGADKYDMGYGFSTCFTLTDSDVEKLKNNKIVSIRINYLGGHYDRDIKGGKQEIISKCLKLVDGEK